MLSKHAQTKRGGRLREDTPKRFVEVEYRKYQNFIKDFVICQVCEISTDLDTPHHTKQGAKKDDRSLINICVECHTTLHSVGYATLSKSRSQLVAIGAGNWDIYEKTKGE